MGAAHHFASAAQLVDQALHFGASPPGVALLTGVAGGGTAAWVANRVQQREANVFPVLYSGAPRLRESNPVVRYYAALNDMVMSVTEAWNAARAAGSYATFAKRLDGAALGAYAAAVRRHGWEFEDELVEHVELAHVAADAAAELDEAWDYSSHDNYRTETYSETYTDSEGRPRTRTRTRRVYEDTDHYFTFHAASAEVARRSLDATLRYRAERLYWPGLEHYEVEPAPQDGGAGPYRSAHGADAQGEQSERHYVVHTILEDQQAELPDDELERYLNAWLRHANATRCLTRAHRALEKLRAEASAAVGTMMASKRKYHFNTRSRSHSGPPGFQAARRMRKRCRTVHGNVTALLRSIERSRRGASALEELAAGTAPAEWRGTPKKVATKALDTVVECYLESFPDSPIDVDQRVSHGRTALVGTLAAVVLGVLSFVFHPQSGVIHY
jgi:hypothetical protein